LSTPLQAEHAAAGVTVHGQTDAVLGGTFADLLLLPVHLDEQTRWAVLDSADVTVSPSDSLDVTRGSVHVVADGVEVSIKRVLDGLDVHRVFSIAAVVLGAEAVGVASWCTQTAAEYAQTRVQFGRPIGQFQGVKH